MPAVGESKMALNKQAFRVRTVSAVFFAALMLAGLLWNRWSFLLLFLVIHGGCWWEYFNLLEKIFRVSYSRLFRLGALLGGTAFVLAFCARSYAINAWPIRENILLPLSATAVCVLAYATYVHHKFLSIQTLTTPMTGWLYISLPLGLLLHLRQWGIVFKGDFLFADFGFIMPLCIVCCIWINDTMAYLVGSFIGKTPLSSISPKKTWEGTLGGIVLAMVLVTIVAWRWLEVPLLYGMLFSVSIAVAGTYGDLFESWLKRRAGVKDSGSMMPGHGGFLDRFDSLLFAIPTAAILHALLQKAMWN
jgi:phosphatidate cytidylyltransferase